MKTPLYRVLLAILLISLLVGASAHFQLPVMGYAAAYWALFFFFPHRPGQESDLMAPAVPLALMTFLYSVIPVLFWLDAGATYLGEPVGTRAVTIYCVANLAGLCGLLAGVRLCPPAPRAAAAPAGPAEAGAVAVRNRIQLRLMTAMAVVSGLACIRFVWEKLDFVHVKTYLDSSGAGRIEKLAEGAAQPLQEVIFQLIPMILITSVAVWAIFNAARIYRLAAAAVFGVSVLTAFLGGNRSDLVRYGIALLTYYHYRIRKIRAVTFILLAAGGIVLVNLVSFLRVTTDVRAMVEVVRESQADNAKTFSLKNSTEFNVGSTLMTLIQSMEDGRLSFNGGAYVVDEMASYLPRAIRPSRPLSMSERYAEFVMPGVLEQGGGLGFYFLGEGYWAFGLPGVFLFSLVFGWLVQRLYVLFKRNLRFEISALAYGWVMYPLIFSSIRSGMVASFKVSLMAAAPFLLLLLLSRRPAA